jgi:glycosyltransferase involved in cell wall biosynthesis
MASAVPVVAAAATGSESLVADGISGRLAPPGDAGQFANALQDYIEQPQLRFAHGQAGELRSRDFDWDRINHTVAETYLRLIAARLASGRAGG